MDLQNITDIVVGSEGFTALVNFSQQNPKIMSNGRPFNAQVVKFKFVIISADNSDEAQESRERYSIDEFLDLRTANPEKYSIDIKID